MKWRVTTKERAAAHKLEAAGKRFLVDFGLQHCGRLPKQKQPKAIPLSAAEKWRRLRRFVLHEQFAFERLEAKHTMDEDFYRGVSRGYQHTRTMMSRLSRVRVRRTK